jgi:hypothetical protein
MRRSSIAASELKQIHNYSTLSAGLLFAQTMDRLRLTAVARAAVKDGTACVMGSRLPYRVRSIRRLCRHGLPLAYVTVDIAKRSLARVLATSFPSVPRFAIGMPQQT